MSFNPLTGQLLLLDATGRQVVSLTLESGQGPDGVDSAGAGQIERTNLALLDDGLGSIAYDAQSGDTLILDSGSSLLYRVNDSGQPLATYDLSELNHPP